MKPLEIVYWARFAAGLIAALVCMGYVLVTPKSSSLPDAGVVFNSISLAIIVYVLSYYIIKAKFKDKVVKTQKLFTTGIGIYFLAWIVFYALFYTMFY